MAFYLVTSPCFDRVKAGYWRGCLEQLYGRYATPYGQDLELLFFKTIQCMDVEKQFASMFTEHKKSGETYSKMHLASYVTFLEGLGLVREIYMKGQSEN